MFIVNSLRVVKQDPSTFRAWIRGVNGSGPSGPIRAPRCPVQQPGEPAELHHLTTPLRAHARENGDAEQMNLGLGRARAPDPPTQRAAIPSEPSKRQGDTEPYPPPEG